MGQRSLRELVPPYNLSDFLAASPISNAELLELECDILVNASGVTVSYFEWVQDTQNFSWTLEEINRRLHQIMTDGFQRTMQRAQRDKLDMRTAALIEGIQRVAEAKLVRGLFP